VHLAAYDALLEAADQPCVLSSPLLTEGLLLQEVAG